MGKIDPAVTKKELRRHYRQEILNSEILSKTTPMALAQRIAGWIITLPDCSQIATFANLPEQEPDLSLLHDLLPNHSLVYPRVDTETVLNFHIVSNPCTLVTGSYGIREPDPRIHPQVLTSDIDLYLCPGLAFGENGSRLGRGGGFYDRALEKARANAPRLGIFFPFQRCDSLPSEEFDIAMTHYDNGNSIIEAKLSL